PETTRMNAKLSRCLRSIPACTLNTTPAKSSVTSRTSSIAVVDVSMALASESRERGAGAMAHRVSRIWCTPKLTSRMRKSEGRSRTAQRVLDRALHRREQATLLLPRRYPRPLLLWPQHHQGRSALLERWLNHRRCG